MLDCTRGQVVANWISERGVEWPALNRRFRERGLLVGGNWGRLADKVFRIGHMGTQADVALVDAAKDVIGESLAG